MDGCQLYMTKTEQALTIVVSGLIVLVAVNVIGDYNFREAQASINENFLAVNENFIKLHETAVQIDMLTTATLILLDEKIDIIMDELFDRVWEDLEQT